MTSRITLQSKAEYISEAIPEQSGFSFIEMMIAVAIVGIISAFAFPSYQAHVYKSRRADAHLALMNASQSVELCQSQNFSYTNCTLPLPLATSDEGNYAITLVTTSDTYALTATAQAVQASDSTCATITLSDQGVRGFTGGGPCW